MQKIILLSLFTVSTCGLLPSLLNNVVDPLVKDLTDIPLVEDLTDIPLVDNLVDVLWGNFKETHGKSYSPEEDGQRRATFSDRLLRIVAANLNRLTYTLGLNKYSDLSHDEYIQYLNGMKINNSSKTNPQPHIQKSHTKLPNAVDWRDGGYVTPVQDQAFCGACWAFSAAGALEGQLKKKTGSLVALSAENLLDCVKDNYGCNGGFMDPAFEYVKQQKGIDTEDSYPYTGIVDKCLFNKSTVGATCKGYAGIPSGDEDVLKQAVATIGPISIAIDADSEEFQSYKSGILDLPNCKNDHNSLSHAILLIGYGTENGVDYWLVKNSWGPTWGIDGYGKLSRNKKNQCGIATLASYPLM